MPAIYHILNGDALRMQFPKTLGGELIIARECLIDGSLAGDTLPAFWKTRATFLQKAFGETTETYEEKVVQEFQKISAIPHDAIVNLWFEDDLFCMTNCWFCLSLLPKELTAFIVKPSPQHGWMGFGAMSPQDLEEAYANKQLLGDTERAQLLACWQAYKTHDLAALQRHAKTPSASFPLLTEVCQAHLDRFPIAPQLSRPASILLQVLAEQEDKSFANVFPIFNQRAGIYGFGDLQVKRIYDQLIAANLPPHA